MIAEGGRKLVVVDTKYKAVAPTSGDLHQVCAYAGVLGVQDVMLLYTEPTEARTLTIAGTGSASTSEVSTWRVTAPPSSSPL